MARRKLPNIEELKKLYVDQNLSASKIANMFDCTSQAIYQALNIHDIRKGRACKWLNEKRVTVPSKRGLELLVSKGFGLQEIGAVYGICVRTLHRILCEHDIELKPVEEKRLNKDLLILLYVEKNLSMADMIKMLDVNERVIKLNLKHHGIKLRGPGRISRRT